MPALVRQGHIVSNIHDMRLSPKVQGDLQRLLATPEKDLEDISIRDYFGPNAAAYIDSNVWLCLHTMLAFRPHHIVMEMRLYLLRSILWEKLAQKHDKFGRPEEIIGDIDQTKWISFFPIIKGYPQFIQKLEELTGSKVGTGGTISIKNLAWELGFILYHKPFFPDQADDEDVFWGNGLSGENIGDYIKKPMFECTGSWPAGPF